VGKSRAWHSTSSTIAGVTFSTMEDSIQPEKTHQKTTDENVDFFVPQTLLFVAVTDRPCLQPFPGSSQRDFPCTGGIRHGKCIHKHLTLVEQLRGVCTLALSRCIHIAPSRTVHLTASLELNMTAIRRQKGS
jgi:hypothetical protein